MFLNLLRFAALFALFFQYGSGAAVTSTSPKNAPIAQYGINGSGCKQGTYKAVLRDDSTSLYATLSDYRVTTAEIRRNCIMSLSLKGIPGKRFVIPGVASKGYTSVQPNSSAEYRAYYYFQGELDQSETSVKKEGPFAGRTNLKNTFSDPIWSPCGEPTVVNINLAASVYGTALVDIYNMEVGPFKLHDC